MVFQNHAAFIRKYTLISLQRGKLFKLVTFVVSFYSLYLDLTFYKNSQIDAHYCQTLFTIHILALVLSLVYILVYSRLEKSQSSRSHRMAKATILSDVFFTLSFAAILSLNSQRFTGNIDAYIMVALVIALVAPIYPKWILGIYGIVHLSFLAALSYFYKSDVILIRQFNATTTVLAALALFLILYRYNVKNFLSEEMLKEGKTTFTRLFESNPFPLIISGFEDGKIQYANRKAMLFYGIDSTALASLALSALYKNPLALEEIRQRLEREKKVSDYMVEQVTLSGQEKNAIVNYQMIDYFGEKSILSGVADITEIKRMENELMTHASIDELTGVLNRRAGMDLLRKKFEWANREQKSFTLCFFDIDNLKLVNDRFGHLEGDSLIVEICKTVKEEIKPGDTFFRYGGDEFMMICDGACEQETDNTCRRIVERFKNNRKPYPINATIGRFFYRPEMNLTLEQLVEIVDKDMYRQKIKKK